MTAGLTTWVLQTGIPTASGNNSSTPPVEINGTGPIGRVLHEFGVPYFRVLGAAISFVVAFVAVYLIGRAVVVPLVNRTLNRRGLDTHEKRPLLRLLRILIGFVALAAAFKAARLSGFFTSIAAIAAAATLAIGLALQDTLSNFVAGVFIYIDRPFRIGDWIEWDNGTYVGEVVDISFRVTKVHTFDNELLTVPNAVLTEDTIKNKVANDELRVQFNFGIGYEDDIEEASDIIIEEAKNHDDILADPVPTVRMTESPYPDRGALADSYVGLTSRVWIADPNRTNYMKIRTEYVTAVKEHFDAVGIDMPDPQIDLSGQAGDNPSVKIRSADK